MKDYFIHRKNFYKKILHIRLGIMAYKFNFLFDRAVECLDLGNIFYECGVGRGGSAAFFAKLLEDANSQGYNLQLHLFDTFEGMPETDPKYDSHKKGDIPSDFEDTKKHIESFLTTSNFIHYHKGLIPDTFVGLEEHKIAFAHIDVDLYSSYKACCEFIYPRLVKNGVMAFDDYGHDCCRGAKTAVDEYFSKMNKPVLKIDPFQHYVEKD